MSLTKKNVITHPKFHDPTPYNNDIALIKLNKPLRKTDYIQPVCIPRHYFQMISFDVTSLYNIYFILYVSSSCDPYVILRNSNMKIARKF